MPLFHTYILVSDTINNKRLLPQDQGVSVKQLAIDGPSENMCKFLRKNYGVEELVRQSNNFAVAPEFFQQDSDEIRYDGPSSLLFFMLCFSLIACLLYTAIDMLFFCKF